LAGVPLGLPVYHILEPEIRQYVPEDVYNENVGVMAMVIDPNEVGERFKKIREKANQA
jgi:betaine reductase